MLNNKEKEAIDLCLSLLRGIADRNTGYYSENVLLGMQLISSVFDDSAKDDLSNASSKYQESVLKKCNSWREDVDPKYIEGYNDALVSYLTDAFENGSHWQRRYDIAHLHKPIKELGDSVDKAYELGKEETLKEFLKNSIDARIIFDYLHGDLTFGRLSYDSFSLEERDLNEDDAVKIVIIKDEEKKQ